MACALDTFAHALNHTTGATSQAVGPFTIANVANRVLAVVTATSGTSTVTSITGAGATWQVAAFGTAANGSVARVEVWYGTGPSTGSQTVTVNFSSLAAGVDYSAGVYSYNGADQTTPLVNFVSRTTAGNLVPTAGASDQCVTMHAALATSTIAGCTTTVDYNDSFNDAEQAAHCAGPTPTFTWSGFSSAVAGAVTIQQVQSGTPTGELDNAILRPTLWRY
jgi:hypothetical protein